MHGVNVCVEKNKFIVLFLFGGSNSCDYVVEDNFYEKYSI